MNRTRFSFEIRVWHALLPSMIVVCYVAVVAMLYIDHSMCAWLAMLPPIHGGKMKCAPVYDILAWPLLEGSIHRTSPACSCTPDTHTTSCDRLQMDTQLTLCKGSAGSCNMRQQPSPRLFKT